MTFRVSYPIAVRTASEYAPENIIDQNFATIKFGKKLNFKLSFTYNKFVVSCPNDKSLSAKLLSPRGPISDYAGNNSCNELVSMFFCNVCQLLKLFNADSPFDQKSVTKNEKMV